MKIRIEVADRDEAQQIRDGLNQSDVRVFVRVAGILSTLPSDRSRRRLLSFIADHFDEEERERG